jgi:hypothetical protein
MFQIVYDLEKLRRYSAVRSTSPPSLILTVELLAVRMGWETAAFLGR